MRSDLQRAFLSCLVVKMKINYQIEMEKIIKGLDCRPKLMLHSCCAPCSSAVIERLMKNFELIIYYYNPNIEPEDEYVKRLEEQKRLLLQASFAEGIKLISGEYDNDEFRRVVHGMENAPEGGIRCRECIRMRMESTALKALELGCEYFATTLSVSPHKNAEYINQIGRELEKKHKVKYLYSDFKKKEGYKRSIALSQMYDLYRQDYCGCLFAKDDTEEND